MSKRIKVRFNLGRGVNYLKWKIEYPDGRVIYSDFEFTQLVMKECTFKNHKKTAEKIYNGANKTVCAWILCEELEIRTDNFITEKGTQARYNPRVAPNWIVNDVVVDGKTYERIHTINRGVFIS
jgi:hypothetical protein